MILRFELTMPNVGSWNGTDTTKKNNSYAFRNVSKKEANEFDGKSFYYNFGDGWGANVIVSKNRRSKTNGFSTYEWMIDEILKYGRILKIEERDELEKATEL